MPSECFAHVGPSRLVLPLAERMVIDQAPQCQWSALGGRREVKSEMYA